jgi:hypothetical protein
MLLISIFADAIFTDDGLQKSVSDELHPPAVRLGEKKQTTSGTVPIVSLLQRV